MSSSSHQPTPQMHPRSASRQRTIRALKILGSWALALLVALALQRYAFQSYQVFGQSMEPTLTEGDYLIISKLGATWADISRHNYIPERGEIVVIKSPLTGNRLIKRVIGLPGERITITNGRVTIYNQQFSDGFDPYQQLGLESSFTAGQLTTVVPDGNLFLIGDNREAGGSLDSRNDLGPVPSDDVIGKLVLRLWPFSKIHKY